LPQNRGFFFLVALLLLASVGLVVGFARGWFAGEEIINRSIVSNDVAATKNAGSTTNSNSDAKSLAESLGIPASEVTSIGGVLRPARDLPTKSKTSSGSIKNPLPSPGALPPLKGNENPQVAGLYAEVADFHAPAASRSAMFLAQEFDEQKYRENPKTYLDKIRPGRVFKPKQPGQGVRPIAAESNRFVTILQNESVNLIIQASPNAPVTFYTPDGGEFGNRLKSISIAANENGIAEVTYRAVSGVAGLIEILGASPLHSGQVKFTVKVVLPDS